MPLAATKMWSPRSSQISKSRTGGRRSARCCCIESHKDQRSSSASLPPNASSTRSRSLGRPPKPSRSCSESRLACKTVGVTQNALTPPLLLGLQETLAEPHTIQPHNVFSAPTCPIVDLGTQVLIRRTAGEAEYSHESSRPDNFKYEEDELRKLAQCATCKQSWLAAFDSHQEELVSLQQVAEREKMKSTKAKKALARERAKLTKMEVEHAENMESLRAALKQEQVLRQEAEEKLECESNRCTTVVDAFESVKSQFELLQGVFQELQPLLGHLAVGFVLESTALKEHIEELTNSAVDRLASFSELAEKTQQLFTSSEEDFLLQSNATALPTLACLPHVSSTPSTRACSSNSSCDEELDNSTDSFGNQQYVSMTFRTSPSVSNEPQDLAGDSDDTCDEDVLFVRPGLTKTASRPAFPAPQRPQPSPSRKASTS